MTIQVFRPYFFTKENQLKIVPIDFNVTSSISTVATAYSNELVLHFQNFSHENLSLNADVLWRIIDSLESFTHDQTEHELSKIEEEILSIPFEHWREELLYYVGIIKKSLKVPDELTLLNEKAVHSSHQDGVEINKQIREIERVLVAYPFENKEGLVDELVQIKSRLTCEDNIQAIEENLIRLEAISKGDFTLDLYKQMKSIEYVLEQNFAKTIQTEQLVALKKNFRMLKKSINNYKSELYSSIREDVNMSEAADILELLAVQPSNLVKDQRRLIESVMAIPKENLQNDSAVEEAIQKTAALCLIEEANSEESLVQGLTYLEWEDFINLGRESRSRMVSYFWKDRSDSLSSLLNEEELRNSINPYIERLHEEIHGVNEATTIESMLIALRTLNIYDAAQYSEKELRNGANYLLLLKETEAFYSINRIKQAFNKGMQNDKQVTTSNGLSVYMSEDSLASNLQLQTSSTDSNEIKIPIAINNINSGSTETITLFK